MKLKYLKLNQLMVGFFLFFSFFFAKSVFAESLYISQNLDDNVCDVGSTGGTWCGQGFASSTTFLLSKITIKLQRVGASTGDSVSVSIYSSSGGNPSSPIYSATNTLAYSSISTSQTDYDFYFNSASSTITANTTYFIVVKGGNGSTFINLANRSGNPYSGTYNKNRYYNGSNWNSTVFDNYDFYFFIYGNPSSVCGNSIIEGTEICDNNSQSCTINGYSGTQTCNGTCNGWNTCVSNDRCGDNLLNGTEQCDGNGTQNCPTGFFRCSSSCTWSTSTCYAYPLLNHNQINAFTSYIYSTTSTSSLQLLSSNTLYTLPLSGYLIIAVVIYFFAILYLVISVIL